VARVTDAREPLSPADGLLDLTGVEQLTTPIARRVPEVSWQGLGTAEDRDAFLGSTARWGDLPLRAGGPSGVALVGGGAQEGGGATAPQPDLEELLGVLAQVGKGVRLELTDGGPLSRRVARVLTQSCFPAAQTRVLAGADTLGREGFEELRAALPDVSIECAVDFLGPLFRVDPEQVHAVVERLRTWGVDRLVLRAEVVDRPALVEALPAWGAEVDVRDARGLRDLLELSASGVRSVATDFGLSRRPTLRHFVDAAMGQSPPVVREQLRRAPKRRTRVRPVG
jgi:hypothetical protein